MLTASDPRLRLGTVACEPAIRLEAVSILYRVPHEHITSFKEWAIRWLQRRVAYTDFWALREVSLEVRPGEGVGVVGANGAGKSTLLKVVARVLHPTRGRVRVAGRVAPLLELGAGFDLELTGRENVYLNGALLGHSRRTMDRRLERIVDFAGLGDFLDAPLRTYSTGMVARLGFAVATDVDADVLLVDEVLAVGDESFRRKCLDRMAEFRQAGATVLLASHDPALVRDLCHWVVWLDRGAIRMAGPADEVVDRYRAEAGR